MTVWEEGISSSNEGVPCSFSIPNSGENCENEDWKKEVKSQTNNNTYFCSTLFPPYLQTSTANPSQLTYHLTLEQRGRKKKKESRRGRREIPRRRQLL